MMIPSSFIPVWLVDLMLMLGIHPSQVLLFLQFFLLLYFPSLPYPLGADSYGVKMHGASF
jgi:hypothetical protein